jgi:hypothetical protein
LAYDPRLPRGVPPPWRVERTPGDYKVLDSNGRALVYVYARETANEANIAGVLTFDEARRIAVNEEAPARRWMDRGSLLSKERPPDQG